MAEEYLTSYRQITPECCIHCQEKVDKQQKQDMQEKQDSTCKHAEDVCQDCLEKVQTTTEDSPRKDSLSFGSKLILFPTVSSFLMASGAFWVVSTKMFYTAAKIAVKLIATPTE